MTQAPRRLLAHSPAGRVDSCLTRRRERGQAATNPEDDDAFLRQLRERADQQRRKAAEERREREAREAHENDLD